VAAAAVGPAVLATAWLNLTEGVSLGMLAAGFVIFTVLAGATSVFASERDTPAGREAAARWLGVRTYLGNDEFFPTLPPAAVAIWDRYLGYGAALGVATGAVQALPMGAEDDHRAWSSFGGRWRMVRVAYPPPGLDRRGARRRGGDDPAPGQGGRRQARGAAEARRRRAPSVGAGCGDLLAQR